VSWTSLSPASPSPMSEFNSGTTSAEQRKIPAVSGVVLIGDT